MALSNSVTRVLRLVEEASGLSVHVEPDPALPEHELAKVTMARDGMPFHRIALQPHASDAPDYLIVFQCGFILRKYTLPAADRFDFSADTTPEDTVRPWLRDDPKTQNLPEPNQAGLADFLFNGLLSQVRSIPVGLRVDAWIRREFPELAALQQQALSKQLNDNAAALSPELQAAMPDQALTANLAMSAAFALFWSEQLDQPPVALPYKTTGHLPLGQALLDLWRDIPEGPAHDQELIDAWAERLGLRGWYRWSKPTGE